MSVDVTSTVRDGLPIVSVVGDIDWGTVSAFRRGVEIHLSSTEPVVLVDLTAIGSWNASGQAVLVRATKEARRQGRWLAVFGLAAGPAKQLRETALAVSLTVFATEEAARAAAPAGMRRPAYSGRGGHRGPVSGGPTSTGTAGTTGTRGAATGPTPQPR